jgi:hypothetical protein
MDVAISSNENNSNTEILDNNEGLRQRRGTSTADNTTTGGNTVSQTAGSGESHGAPWGLPIRRVRHAEVVLVDDVCVAFDRYWLRLRWPGGRGGFAGYIALGKVTEEPLWLMNDAIPSRTPLGKYWMAMICDGIIFVCGHDRDELDVSPELVLQKFAMSTIMTPIQVCKEETMMIESPVMTWTMMTLPATMSRRTMPAPGHQSHLNPRQP